MYVNLSPTEIERCFRTPDYIKKVDAFDSLPNELIHLILSHVDAKTLGRCELLSKRWWFVINGTGLWNDYIRRDFDPAFDPNDLFNSGLQGKRKYRADFNIRTQEGHVREIFLTKLDFFPDFSEFEKYEILSYEDYMDLPESKWSSNSRVVLLYNKIFSRYRYSSIWSFFKQTYLQGKEIMTLPPHAHIQIAAFSSDGKLLIAGGDKYPFSVVMDDGNVGWLSQRNRKGQFLSRGDVLPFSIVNGNVGWLSLWNRQGKLLYVWRGHERPITFVSFLPGDNKIISVSNDSVSHTWLIKKTAVPFSIKISLLEANPPSLERIANLGRIQNVSAHTFSNLEDMSHSEYFAHFPPSYDSCLPYSHIKDSHQVFYLPNNTAILGLCQCKKRYLLWSCEGKLQATFKKGSLDLQFSPDGRSLAIKYDVLSGEKICLRNYEGKKINSYTIKNGFFIFGFSLNSKIFYFYSNTVLCLVDATTGSLLRRFKGSFSHVEFSPDSTALCITTLDGTKYILDFVPAEND